MNEIKVEFRQVGRRKMSSVHNMSQVTRNNLIRTIKRNGALGSRHIDFEPAARYGELGFQVFNIFAGGFRHVGSVVIHTQADLSEIYD